MEFPKSAVVAIQGWAGSFHDEVLQKHFVDPEIVSCSTFAEGLENVCTGQAPFGVVARKNSAAGKVPGVAELLIEYDQQIQILQIIRHPIRQHLIGLPESKISEVTIVSSHLMALKQCNQFLSQYDWSLIENSDTALSVELVAEQRDKSCAAIGSARAAEIHKLQILQSDIHNDPKNYTEFVLFSKISQYNSN